MSLIGFMPLAGASLTGVVALAWLTLRSRPLMLAIGLAFHRSGCSEAAPIATGRVESWAAK
jgi:hypothetical protein